MTRDLGSQRLESRRSSTPVCYLPSPPSSFARGRFLSLFPSRLSSGRAHEHRPLPASAADAILRGESTRNDGARIQASWKVHGMCRWIASIHRPLALLWTYSACNRLGHQLEAQALERRHLHTGMACRLLPPRRTRQAIVEFVRGSNIEVPISLDRSSRHMLTPSEPVN